MNYSIIICKNIFILHLLNSRERGFQGNNQNQRQNKGEWSSYKKNSTPPQNKDEINKSKEKASTPVKKPEDADQIKPIQSTTPSEKPQTTTTPSARARSRSPVDKKTNDSDINNGASTSKESNNTAPRYTGKPGEKKFSGRCRLFVANMVNTTTESELRSMFTPYGETGEVYINKDKGFGFIRLVS